MGFNVRTNLFLIILLFSSFFVAAEDTECCIYHAGGNRFYCTEDVGNSAFSPGGVCTSYIEDIENSYVGKIASPCNEVPECNFVCLQTLDLNQLLTYNMTYIYDQDTVDSFVYINSIDSDFDEAVSTIDSDTFKSTVGCSDQIPLCNEDASLEAKRCNSTTDFDNDKCLCVFSGGSRTILSSSTDLYCGKFEVEEGYDKCQDSFVEARLYDYNFTFTITFEDENDILLPLQDIDVIVQNIQFDNGGSTSEQFTGITDSSGESIVTVSVNSIIDSVHISISGDGYEEIYEFVDLTFEFEGYEKAISRTLMIDNGCDDGDINYYPITDDCVYIQECEEISGSWMWGSIKEDPDNECEIQKDRCDDNVLDINLGEECVPGGPDVCGGGRFCNNDCYCENLVEGVCSNNGTLEDWEFCDKNYLNSLPDSEKWKAFNIPKDSYVAGMDCALDCTIIPVRTCGNGEYEPGETCEFIFNEDDTIYQHSLLNDPQLRCELVSDCREIGSIGECTCKIEVNCGDDIIQGAEECDGTSDFSCGGRGCGDDCRCIMPTCPLESDLLFNNATFDSDKLSLKFNVTNCSEDPIQKLNIVYYKSESEGGDDSIVIETKKFIELDITNSNLFGENINLDFTLEPLTLDVFTTSNLLLSNPDSEIILEDNSRYCFYLEAEYDQNPSFIFPQTLRSEPIKCVDIGDPICGGDTEGSYCYRNDIYYCDGREPSECADDEICRADGNTAECVNITNHDACTYECGDTFGMFSFLEYVYPISNSGILEGVTIGCYDFLSDDNIYNECYLDYSETSVDKFENCLGIDSCYDYNSEYACTQNACKMEECEWGNNNYDYFGEGVCHPIIYEQQDCTVCNENSMRNVLLSGCDKDSCDNYGDNCYFNNPNTNLNDKITLKTRENKGCQDLNEIGCIYLDTKEECIGEDGTNFSINALNNTILTRSNDILGVGTCKWKDSFGCIKDSDDDDSFDCYNIPDYLDFMECSTDNLPPITQIEMSDYLNGSFNFEIFRSDNLYGFDEIKTNWSIVRFGDEYVKPNITIEGDYLIEDLRDYESDDYTFYYFSYDPAKNLEEVKKKVIYLDNDPPNISIIYDTDYYVVSSYFEDEVEVYAANLTINTLISDNRSRKANCTLRLYEKDASTLTNIEKYPDRLSIVDRVYEYDETSDGATVSIFYPGLLMGDYIYNVTCTDLAGNVRNVEKYITLSDQRIYNFTPNSTLSGSPINVSFLTEYEGDCLLTDFNNIDKTYDELVSATAGIVPAAYDLGRGTKKHIFYWEGTESILNKFPDSLTEDIAGTSFVTEKYYVKCSFTEAEHVGELAGGRGNYIQFAVDNTPPQIYGVSFKDNINFTINDEWRHKFNYRFYATDWPLMDIYGKSWEMGIDELKINITFSDDKDVQKGLINTLSYDDECENPLIGADVRSSICSDLLLPTDPMQFQNTGLYTVYATGIDKLENSYTEDFSMKVDNDEYMFNLYIGGDFEGVLKSEKYAFELIPTKNVTIFRDKLDINYTIHLPFLIVSLKDDAGQLKNYTLGSLTLEEDKFIGELDFSTFEYERINNLRLRFSVESFDSHNITSITVNNSENFTLDTQPPSKPEFKTLLEKAPTREREIQYENQNGDEYPLYYYEEKYYTNQNSLYFTGTADTDSEVIFSWGSHNNKNASYKVYENDVILGPIYSNRRIVTIMNPSQLILDVEDGVLRNVDLSNYWLEFNAPVRDTFGNYNKRFNITLQESITEGEYVGRKVTLNPSIDIDSFYGVESVNIYESKVNTNYFGVWVDLPLNTGCNQLFFKAVDENTNECPYESVLICKDQIKPMLKGIDALIPPNNSLSTIIDKNVTVRLQDDNGIVIGNSVDYLPELLVNDLSKNYNIKGDAQNSEIYYQNTEEGVFYAYLKVFDFAHNYREISWQFTFNDSYPENPDYLFDVGSNMYGDKEYYFMNELPQTIALNFSMNVNRTINFLKIYNQDILGGIPYNFNDNITPYRGIDAIGLSMNEVYDSSINLSNIGEDEVLTWTYDKKIILDDQEPEIEIMTMDGALIGLTYIQDYSSTHFPISFFIHGENYFPDEESMYIQFTGLPDSEVNPQQITPDNCIYPTEPFDQYIECEYEFGFTNIPDGAELTYYIYLEDKAGNYGESEIYNLSVDREYPKVNITFNGTNSYIEYEELGQAYDKMYHPETYVFKATASKELDLGSLRIFFNIPSSSISGEIKNGDIIYDPLINDEFYFVFNLSDFNSYEDLQPFNGIDGEILFTLDANDLSGNYMPNVPTNYTSNNDAELWLYSKIPQPPTFSPILHISSPEEQTPKDSSNPEIQDFDYPIYYYNTLEKYFTNEPETIHLTGFAQSSGYTLNLYDSTSSDPIATYTTSTPEIGDYEGTLWLDANKDENTIVVTGGISNSRFSEDACIIFGNSPNYIHRKSYGNYHKGYPIESFTYNYGPSGSPESTNIVLTDTLEVDLSKNTPINFVYGDCHYEPDYFDLEVDISEKNVYNLELVVIDRFEQMVGYDLATLYKDESIPEINPIYPVDGQIIVSEEVIIRFTVCDDNPGILGTVDLDGNRVGMDSDFEVYVDGNLIENGPLTSIYPEDNGQTYCYDYSSASITPGLGEHEVKVKILDFAHNGGERNYGFIVDPLSPDLTLFNLSDSLGLIYPYISEVGDVYNMMFTRSTNPTIFINFSDQDVVDFFQVKLSKIPSVDDLKEPAILVFPTLYYDNLKNTEEFNCNRITSNGPNYFECEFNETLTSDYIYKFDFKANKTVDEEGGIKNEISPLITKYFVYDNNLDYFSIENEDVIKSTDLSFEIKTSEIFGLNARFDILDRDGEIDSHYLDLVSSENLGEYTSERIDTFEIDLIEDGSTMYAGDYNFTLYVSDYAGNMIALDGIITIDDISPIIYITNLSTYNPEIEIFKLEDISDIASGNLNTYNERLIIKTAQLSISGSFENDEVRFIPDLESMSIVLKDSSDQFLERHDFDACDSTCSYSDIVYINTNAKEGNAKGCFCKENNYFRFIISSQSIPYIIDSETESYMLLMAWDEAGNDEIMRASVLTDFEPPRLQNVRLIR